MKIETWYYLKEIDGQLEDHKIREVYMFKEDGKYTHLIEEESGLGAQSIIDFPYHLYKNRDHAMEKFKKIIRQYRESKYCKKKLDGSGLDEHVIMLGGIDE